MPTTGSSDHRAEAVHDPHEAATKLQRNPGRGHALARACTVEGSKVGRLRPEAHVASPERTKVPQAIIGASKNGFITPQRVPECLRTLLGAETSYSTPKRLSSTTPSTLIKGLSQFSPSSLNFEKTLNDFPEKRPSPGFRGGRTAGSPLGATTPGSA